MKKQKNKEEKCGGMPAKTNNFGRCLNILSNDPQASTYKFGGDYGASIKKKYDWQIDFFYVRANELMLEGTFRNREKDMQNDMLLWIENADPKLIKGLKYIERKYDTLKQDVPHITQLLEVMFQKEIEEEYERYYDCY